ncbi:MAG: carbohydrate-binding domain-containing protein [Clostridia bacterium]|nr:carbohydrate-binding domain-containing protein [Clostridia bacterium]
MKRMLAIFLALFLCTGCANTNIGETNKRHTYQSRFSSEQTIELSDSGIKQNGEPVGETGSIYVSHDIIYYEDKESYDSGMPYGEGTKEERHTQEEALAHTVLNITESGAYRISGTLSAGQIRVDLGENAKENSESVVELILDNANITCSVAPAILFMNVYEWDYAWSTETAKADVDTKDVGAVLVFADGSENNIQGSHVAKIFKDQEGEKKLWKQDGAIYSYMSMNVFGGGTLNLVADNEGMDTELHLTINGGNLNIYSDNDGINTNEDGVSVTTINGGNIKIVAGLGVEGDGIDSNGWLMINGGTVLASANPKADAGLDSDMGSYINGGTVIAFGSTMDWPESDSEQVTMNLQFAKAQNATDGVVIKDSDGKEIFVYEPVKEVKAEGQNRDYQGAVISSPELEVGKEYSLYIGGVKQGYTGTDIFGGPGGFHGMKPSEMGERPPEEMPEMPGDFEGKMPPRPQGEQGQDFKGKGWRPDFADGEMPKKPEGGWGEMPKGEFPEWMGEAPLDGDPQPIEQKTNFVMTDKVNRFSGVSAEE